MRWWYRQAEGRMIDGITLAIGLAFGALSIVRAFRKGAA